MSMRGGLANRALAVACLMATAALSRVHSFIPGSQPEDNGGATLADVQSEPQWRRGRRTRVAPPRSSGAAAAKRASRHRRNIAKHPRGVG